MTTRIILASVLCLIVTTTVGLAQYQSCNTLCQGLSTTNSVSISTSYSCSTIKPGSMWESGQMAYLPFSITNIGSTNNRYNVGLCLIGPEMGWGNCELSRYCSDSPLLRGITLAPGETKRFSPAIWLPKNAKEGTYSVTIQVRDQNNNVAYCQTQSGCIKVKN